MTGPEHYREAERLLTEAAAIEVDSTDPVTLPILTRAQVHATLALTAATAVRDSPDDWSPRAGRPVAWLDLGQLGGGYVCAVPAPEMPSGICGMPVESEPCGDHGRAGPDGGDRG